MIVPFDQRNIRPLRLTPAEEISISELAADCDIIIKQIQSHCDICSNYQAIEDWDGFLFAAEKIFAATTDLRRLTREIKPIIEASENRYRKMSEKTSSKETKATGPP